MNKKAIWFIIITALTASLIAGCAAPTATPAPATAAPTEEAQATTGPVVVTDAVGRTVTFDTLPQRIVIAGKATALLLDTFYMFPEASSKLAGYELRSQNGSDFLKIIDPDLAAKTMLENNSSAEQIAALTPDLVILKTYMQESMGATLDTLGIKVLYVDMETPETFYADVRNLGAVLGNSVRAEELVSYYQGVVDGINAKTATLAEADKPTVLLLQQSTKDNEVAFKVAPTAWLQTLMVTKGGGTPVWTEVADAGGWTIVTVEQVAAWNPDIILVVNYSGDAVAVVDQLKVDATWSALKAVQNGTIYAFPLDFVSWDQPDSRWSLGMLWTATKVQPELFADVNMTDEITNFYKTVYGLDDTVIQEQILPLLKTN
jgi:iron complex transport system substrate-binding protein